MAAQMLSAIPSCSAVVDEPAHLTAGYLALAQGDLVVNREHPPLVKTLAAIPLIWMRPALPPAPPAGASRASEDFEFAYAREFLYRANDADRLLHAARLPVVALTLLMAAVVFVWGRAMMGDAAGLAALALVAFEPNLLAHGRLVTTDMGAALFTVACLACLERGMAAARRGAALAWTVACGAALGLGLLTRYSCLLLVPVMAAALAFDGGRRPPSRLRRLALAVGVALLIVSLTYALWGYGLTSSLFPLAATPVAGPLMSSPLDRMESFPVLRWAPLMLPRLYLEGLDLARDKNQRVEGPGYLDGAYSADGWWSYFVLALCMKATIPWLLLAAAGAALTAAALRRRGSGAARPALYVLLPAVALLFLITAATRAQIGLRYVLPVIPLLSLAGGAAAARLVAPSSRAGWPTLGRRAAATALLAWHAMAALSIHPYHLAYFNEAVGGPDAGVRHLVDSNLDWGQDLVGLSRFMKARDISRINLYYFGTADPRYYGIERLTRPEPGYFAVSATHLAGVYLPDRGYLAPFLRMRPEATIGHSIFVYKLDQVPPFLTVPIRRP